MNTPQTNSRIRKMLSGLQSGVDEVVDADFARELERENHRLRKVLQIISEYYSGSGYVGALASNALSSQTKALEEQ